MVAYPANHKHLTSADCLAQGNLGLYLALLIKQILFILIFSFATVALAETVSYEAKSIKAVKGKGFIELDEAEEIQYKGKSTKSAFISVVNIYSLKTVTSGGLVIPESVGGDGKKETKESGCIIGLLAGNYSANITITNQSCREVIEQINISTSKQQ